MSDSKPTHHQPFHWKHVWRILVASAAFALTVGYILSDLDRTVGKWLPQLASAVAAVTLTIWLTEIRITRRLARAEARQRSMETQLHLHLEQVVLRVDIRMRMADYAEGYVDGLQRRAPDHHERHLRPVP